MAKKKLDPCKIKTSRSGSGLNFKEGGFAQYVFHLESPCSERRPPELNRKRCTHYSRGSRRPVSRNRHRPNEYRGDDDAIIRSGEEQKRRPTTQTSHDIFRVLIRAVFFLVCFPFYTKRRGTFRCVSCLYICSFVSPSDYAPNGCRSSDALTSFL